MLYAPKVNCMYLRYRAGFASRTFLLLVFRGRSISIDWYAHLNTVCSFYDKSWIIAPKISHNMLWTYLTVMAKTKLKLSCIKRTTYKRKSISGHIPSKRLKTFLPGHPPSTTKKNPGSTTHKYSRKKITVGRTPSKQTAKQRGRR